MVQCEHFMSRVHGSLVTIIAYKTYVVYASSLFSSYKAVKARDDNKWHTLWCRGLTISSLHA